MSTPLVAIVGAPNVGKSTLFNRLVGRRQAIVTDEPGMTRDRLYGRVDHEGGRFRIVDTGGLTPGEPVAFAQEIELQASAAMDEAALILFLVDARAGASGLDEELAGMLRTRGRPVMLVANKVDSDRLAADAHEFYCLGLGEPVPISAEHGRGIEDLVDQIASRVATSDAAEDPDDDDAIRVAIVGRPNVGKSSIFNRLCGEERTMVSAVPGTTRDAIDTMITLGRSRYRLIDTAGLRRRGRVSGAPEHRSVRRARENIERCDVALLVLDATDDELAAQDTHVAGHILDAYRPLVVAVNKWDAIDGREAAARMWEERVRHRLRFAKHVPVYFVSALSGQRVTRLLEGVDRLHSAAAIRVPTQALNRWLQGLGPGNPYSPPPRGTGFRLYYATQTGVHPPTFVLFCNDPSRAHFSVRRQLENGLRERFGFDGAPIRLRLRPRRRATTA